MERDERVKTSKRMDSQDVRKRGAFGHRAVAAALLALLGIAPGLAAAQPADAAQQRCINTRNQELERVHSAQARDQQRCVRDAARGRLTGTVDQCVVADELGKVAIAQNRAATRDAARCSGVTPPFGPTDMSLLNQLAPQAALDVMHGIFGDDLDAAVVSATVDRHASVCQRSTLRQVQRCEKSTYRAFNRCKRDGLRGANAPAGADLPFDDASDLALCQGDDPRGTIVRNCDTLLTSIVDTRCASRGVDLETAFPGCQAGDPASTAACMANRVRCATCLALNQGDALGLSCDLVDDATPNGSCTPLATARQISDPTDLITGPLAHGAVGDYLIENSRVRFVIQDAPGRDLTGVAQFGGNIIDAAVVGRPGLDNLIELQPMVNIETVVHATSVELVNDGSDGNPAIVRSCGPDDLLDYINASTLVNELVGLPVFPASADEVDHDVTVCTEYRLAGDESYLEMETTVFNMEPAPVQLYVGDYLNGGGELEQWTGSGSNPPGFATGIGEAQVTNSLNVFSLYGFGEATGVDYAYVPTSLSMPGATDSSSFTQSGVSAIFHSQPVLNVLLGGAPPVFTVPAQVGGVPGSASFVRFFGVGDGSGANALAIEAEQKALTIGTLRGCLTVGGAPVAGARVTAGDDDGTGRIGVIRSHWVTDDAGCYRGVLPPGSYRVAAGRKGTPYEGDGPEPVYHAVNIGAGAETVQDFALPATGHVWVSVVDENDGPLPARVSIVGVDPSPEVFLDQVNLAGLIAIDSTLLHDDTKDPLSFGLTWIEYADADGMASFDLEPGSYELFVSRGTEYSVFQTSIVVSAGATTSVPNAKIGKVVDTPGFVSSDFHVHQINSSDSRIALRKRVSQFAGEGVDNIIATDHDHHTDLNPTIASLALSDFVHATTGEEVTTFDYGHFNAYPLGIDPSKPSGGSTDWARPPVPNVPGTDFPSLGNYTSTPAEIESLIKTDPLNTSSEVAVQINHIDSHFSPLKIDTAVTPPTSFLSAAENGARRVAPGAGNLFNGFDALEVWNGSTRSQQISEFLGERIGIWFNHLNQGIPITGIFDTDTHGFFNTRGGGARSWTASSADDASQIVSDAAFDDEIGASVKAGRVVGGQGVYVQARLLETDGAGGTTGAAADFSLAGSTMLAVTNDEVLLEVRVQAPLWAPFDRIEIYRNATSQCVGQNGGVDVLYGAVPTEVLDAGSDFSSSIVNVHPGVPNGDRRETTVTVPYTVAAGTALTQDSWFVVIVRGTDGISAPMFPVMPASLDRASNEDPNPAVELANLLDGNLGESGVLALGVTNALYVDVDGGGFDAPGVAALACP